MVDIIQIEAGPIDSNIYLVRGNKTNVLVDTGTGTSSRTVESSIKRNLEGERLDGIVLTHEHFDHSGGAAHLKREFGAPLYGSPECSKALREANPVMTGSFLFGASMEPIADIKETGSILDIKGLSFEVYPAPGHAPGLVCLVERSERHLFCGDLVFCDGGVGRWDLPGGNLDLLATSIRNAMSWDIRSLYPGHGRYETRDPKGQIELSMRMMEMF
ncbi:MAG: MBL fold metallo-hydrolase [Candidatus Thermoplasmatota archaeon]|nr:MBL fold metallo-hydrolase [Candidatus Thermoplasmatota archaeon]